VIGKPNPLEDGTTTSMGSSIAASATPPEKPDDLTFEQAVEQQEQIGL
jgi:hypothetical protein